MLGPPMADVGFSMTHAVHPVLGLDFAFGGTPERNTGASHDSWARILTFLDTAFAQS